MRLARDAGTRGEIERAGEEGRHVGHDVDRRIGGVAVVHDDDRHAVARHHARHVGIALQAPHVVDHAGAGLRAPRAATCAFMVSIDTGTPSAATAASTGSSRRTSSLERHRRGGAVRTGGFRADIDDVRALRHHAAGMRDGGLRIEKAAAVRERIRGDVEDAHHDRAAGREQPGKRAGSRPRRRAGCRIGTGWPSSWLWLCAGPGRGVKRRDRGTGCRGSVRPDRRYR